MKTAQNSISLEELEKGFEERSLVMIEMALLPAIQKGNMVLQEDMPEQIASTVIDSARAEARTAVKNDSFQSKAPQELPEDKPLRVSQDIEFGLVFDANSPEALLWAQQRSANLVVGLNQNTRAGVRSVVVQAFDELIPPAEAARLIKPLVGLTEPSANAVANLRKRMLNPENWGKTIKAGKTKIRIPEAGPSKALIQSRTSKYADRLLRKRAISIARTEVIAASNEGQRQVWRTAQTEGLLSDRALRVWIITPDERLCPICEPLEGVTAPVNEPFVSPDTGEEFGAPPAHIMCRCAMGISEELAPVEETIQ